MLDLYVENYTTLMKEIKDLSKWSWKIQHSKEVNLSKLITQFNAIPNRMFSHVRQNTLKFIWKGKEIRISKTTLKMKNKKQFLKAIWKAVSQATVLSKVFK